MMTIDEAIEQERDNAEFSICNCYDKSAEYHNQIAEWLEELKSYKSDEFTKNLQELVYKQGYNKAIDDFAKWLESKKYLMKEIHDHYLCYTHYDEMQANDVIREYLAEQLKAGVEND